MDEPRIAFAPDAVPRPTKIAVFSEQDLPRRPDPPPWQPDLTALLGRPAVIEIDGEAMRMRTSPYVRSGTFLVIDEANLTVEGTQTWP